MNQPMGRVLRVRYRHIAAHPGQAVPTVPVITVELRTHTDTVDTVDLQNINYTVQCPALQFLAKYGYQPTDFDDDGVLDVEDEQWLVPIAPHPEEDAWTFAKGVMEGADDALRDADWFKGLDANDDDEPPTAGPGGGDADPGTGNRGGVGKPSDAEEVEVEG